MYTPELAFAMITIGLLLIATLTLDARWLLTRPGLLWLGAVLGVPLLIGAVSVLWVPVMLPRALIVIGPLIAIRLAGSAAKFSLGQVLSAILLTALIASSVSSELELGKPTIVEHVFEYCDERPLFALSTSSAIYLSYYRDDVTLFTRGDGPDQTLSAATKRALQLETAPVPEDDACVVYFDTIHATDQQRALVETLGEPQHTFPVNVTFEVYLW
jgi:hypothetical protein